MTPQLHQNDISFFFSFFLVPSFQRAQFSTLFFGENGALGGGTSLYLEDNCLDSKALLLLGDILTFTQRRDFFLFRSHSGICVEFSSTCIQFPRFSDAKHTMNFTCKWPCHNCICVGAYKRQLTFYGSFTGRAKSILGLVQHDVNVITMFTSFLVN